MDEKSIPFVDTGFSDLYNNPRHSILGIRSFGPLELQWLRALAATRCSNLWPVFELAVDGNASSWVDSDMLEISRFHDNKTKTSVNRHPKFSFSRIPPLPSTEQHVKYNYFHRHLQVRIRYNWPYLVTPPLTVRKGLLTISIQRRGAPKHNYTDQETQTDLPMNQSRDPQTNRLIQSTVNHHSALKESARATQTLRVRHNQKRAPDLPTRFTNWRRF